MSELRAQPRRRRWLPVFLGGRVTAVTADVSRNGFSAEMPAVFLPGSFVHGTILVGGKEHPFKGEVTWARAGNPRASVRSRFGVRFTDLAPEVAEQLAK